MPSTVRARIIGFDPHVGGNRAGAVTPLCDDGADADHVLLAESFALRVDRAQGNGRRLQCIDPQMRRTPRMRRATDEADTLDQRAIVRVTDARQAIIRAARRMGDGDHVDIVELTQPDQLGLSQDEFQLTARATGKSLLNRNALLGRNSEKHDIAVEFVHDCLQAQSRADHGGNLRIMPATMRSSCFGIGHRTVGDQQTVHLAQDADGQRASAPFHPRLHTGECETGTVLQPHVGKLIGNVGCCFRLTKPNLGMRQDVLADGDDTIGLPVDLRAHAGLELFLGHGTSSLSIGCRL
jgi:hypothetical protein